MEESQQPAKNEPGCERGCGCVGLLLISLFFLARLGGGMMGDHGAFKSAAEAAEYQARTSWWMWSSFLGFAASTAAGLWWAKNTGMLK